LPTFILKGFIMTNVQITTRPNIWFTALSVGVVAAIANVIVYFIAEAANVPLQITSPGSSQLQQLPLIPVALASLIPAFAAAAVLLLLRRFTRQANLIFQVIAVVFLLASLSGPLGMPIDAGTKLVLNLMHLIAGVVITLGLARSRQM
jgi:Family of unknown function (DUF6069)